MPKRNKPKPIIISPQAKEDIDSILLYLSENWNPKPVDDFLSRLEAFYLAISLNPRIFGYYDKRKNIRKYVLTRYHVIYYRNRKIQIEIITVFDGRRSPVTLKK